MSYELPIMDMTGKVVKKRPLSPSIFSVEHINQGLLHQYVVMYLANQRNPIAHTKTRGEVHGSGRKLYKQKGSGRARVGDAQSPVRKGGGIAFGPRNNVNHSLAMPKKMKRQALVQALSLKAKDTEIIGLDAFTVATPKTKSAAQTLLALGATAKKILIVVDGTDTNIFCSFRNIPSVTTTNVRQLNPYQILTHQKIVFVGGALDSLEAHFLSA